MAVTVASLQAVLDLDEKKFNRGLKSADKALGKFEDQLPELGDSMDKATKKMDKFGNEARESLEDAEAGADNALGGISNLVAGLNPLAVLGGVILGGLAAAVVGIGTAAISASKEFGGAMRQIEARTGKTGAELQDLGEVTKEVFVDNWGDSLADAADAVIAVNQVLGLTGDAAKEAAEGALILRDVFGKDIDETMRSTNSLVKSFGITTQEAMDMIAKVIQNVGDPSGDLQDTAQEYATIFANAGFSAQEMFGILEEGSRQGIRNFDQTADAVKEFIIRIETGSDEAIEALNKLFREVGEGDQAFFELQDAIGEIDQALADNKRALEDSEGAYDAQKRVVDELQRALDDSRRALEGLSRPRLEGYEEFEQKIFDVQQAANAAELALLGLEPDTKPYEATQKELESLNKQLDELRLRQGLIFDPVLFKLDKKLRDTKDEAVGIDKAFQNFDEVAANVALLEQNLDLARDTLAPLEGDFLAVKAENELLTAETQRLQDELANTISPAEELLQTYQAGGISIRDMLEQITGMMGQLDTAAQQDIGQALFGTKFEDNGEAFLRIFTEGIPVLEDWAGTVEAAGDAVSDGPWNAFQQALREIQIALIPLGDLFVQLVDDNMPAIQSFVDWLVSTGVPGMIDFSKGTVDAMVPVIELFADLVKSVVTLAEDFATLLDKTGLFNQDLNSMDILIGAVKLALLPMAATIMGITAAVQTLDSAINSLNDVLSGSINPLEKWKKGMSNIGDSIWQKASMLLPNSPQSPLAKGIESVSEALGNFPQLNSGLGGLVGAGGGGGGSSVTVNIGGVSATTNTGGNANDEAIRLTLQLLRGQLETAG